MPTLQPSGCQVPIAHWNFCCPVQIVHKVLQAGPTFKASSAIRVHRTKHLCRSTMHYPGGGGGGIWCGENLVRNLEYHEKNVVQSLNRRN